MQKVEDGCHRDNFDNIHWTSKARIMQIELHEIVWKEPEEQLEPYDDYHGKSGDPSSNDRGDKEIKGPNGQRFVKYKVTSNMWSRQNIVRQQAKKEYEVPQGDDAFFF